jgi:chemotaxis protein CheD
MSEAVNGFGGMTQALRQVVIGISDAKVSRDPDSMLVTYALGSCIAVCLFEPVARVAGMLHIMLPDSTLDLRKAEANPWMFADTGVAQLLRHMAAHGAAERRLKVRLAGGAQVMNDGGIFNIGKRNHTAVRKILWKAGLMVDGEATGGEVSRTVRMEVGTGRLWVREGGRLDRELPLKGSSYGR